VLRSPHVNKIRAISSRFEPPAADGHHRPDDKTVDALMKLESASGVDVEIKVQ